MSTLKPAVIHVVCPHDEAYDADRNHRIRHAEIAEYRFPREGRHDVADYAEARQNEDVDLRMTEKPEEVRVEQRIATARRIVERCAEVTIRQQHRDRTR